MSYEIVPQCRVCNADGLTQIMDFGPQVIANHFHTSIEPDGAKMPLRLVKCPKCSLVQLGEKIDTDMMYRNYWYQSGINATMRDHLASLASQICSIAAPKPDDIVIDIGCNDGTLLKHLPAYVRKIGVDPSNIESSGCERIVDYFNADSVSTALDGKKAKIITSIAMFYDLNDPKDFVRNIRACLSDDGIWVAELSYLPRMLENVAYDSVCHEHVTYYRLHTFAKTLEGTGLGIFHAEINDMNGSSFRVFMAPIGCCHGRNWSSSLVKIMDAEKHNGLDTDAPYEHFAARIKNSTQALMAILGDAKKAGKKVFGYGASTKGQVMLQHCGIDSSLVTAIAERNPRKYGLLTPGTNIPICSEADMRQAKPDFLVIFPWYFLNEFLVREQSLRDGGCKIIVPLPEVQIL